MALRERVAPPIGGRRQVSGSREDLVAQYRTRLLEEVDLDEVAGLERPQQRARLERVLSRILSLEGPVMSPRERTWLVKRIIDDAVGLGVLEPLIADHSVTEIMVNGADDVFVERSGRIERVPTRFISEAELYQVIDRIVSSVNRRVDESSPMVDARLPGGERVNVIIPPLALDGPTITIRRFPEPFRLPDLVARRSLPKEAADLLAPWWRRDSISSSRAEPAPARPPFSTPCPARSRTVSALSPLRTPPSSPCSSRTWCAWRPAPPTPRGAAR